VGLFRSIQGFVRRHGGVRDRSVRVSGTVQVPVLRVSGGDYEGEIGCKAVLSRTSFTGENEEGVPDLLGSFA
jgi:hypothetical protein